MRICFSVHLISTSTHCDTREFFLHFRRWIQLAEPHCKFWRYLASTAAAAGSKVNQMMSGIFWSSCIFPRFLCRRACRCTLTFANALRRNSMTLEHWRQIGKRTYVHVPSTSQLIVLPVAPFCSVAGWGELMIFTTVVKSFCTDVSIGFLILLCRGAKSYSAHSSSQSFRQGCAMVLPAV